MSIWIQCQKTIVYILARLLASFMMKRNNNKPTNKTNKQNSPKLTKTNKGNKKKGADFEANGSEFERWLVSEELEQLPHCTMS